MTPPDTSPAADVWCIRLPDRSYLAALTSAKLGLALHAWLHRQGNWGDGKTKLTVGGVETYFPQHYFRFMGAAKRVPLGMCDIWTLLHLREGARRANDLETVAAIDIAGRPWIYFETLNPDALLRQEDPGVTQWWIEGPARPHEPVRTIGAVLGAIRFRLAPYVGVAWENLIPHVVDDHGRDFDGREDQPTEGLYVLRVHYGLGAGRGLPT